MSVFVYITVGRSVSWTIRFVIFTSPVIHLVCPQVWHNFAFNLSWVAVVSREIEDNAYANLEGKQGALWEFCKRIEAEKNVKLPDSDTASSPGLFRPFHLLKEKPW